MRAEVRLKNCFCAVGARGSRGRVEAERGRPAGAEVLPRDLFLCPAKAIWIMSDDHRV